MIQRLYFTLLIYSLALNSVLTQINGVSGSKINAFNHLPIPVGTAEFEPNIGITRYSQYWDDNSNLQSVFQSPDSLQIESTISFRMAYPLSTKLELGTFIATDFSNWSLKYALGGDDKFGYGLMCGLNLPYGITTINKKSRTAEQISSYGLGIIGSYTINETTSIDANLQYQDYLHTAPGLSDGDIFFSIDYGKYIKGRTQLMSSIVYSHSLGEETNGYVLTYYPGIGLESKGEYMIFLSGAIDLIGKNTLKTSGFAAAWTITL